MKTEFALFNPKTSEYIRAGSKEEAVVIAAQLAADFYFSHAHGCPAVLVHTDDEGNETWTAPDGTNIMSPAELAAQEEAIRREIASFKNAEQIPTTNL